MDLGLPRSSITDWAVPGRATVAGGAGSCRTGGLDADCLGGFKEAFVVGHELSELTTQLLGCREMDRVQRSQFRWRKTTGDVEDSIADPDEVQASQDGSTSSQAWLALEHQ